MLKKGLSFFLVLSSLLVSCVGKEESSTSSTNDSDNVVTNVPALGIRGQHVYHIGLNETAYCGVSFTEEQYRYISGKNIPQTENVYRVVGIVSEQDTSGLVFSTVTDTNSNGLYWENLIKFTCTKEFDEAIFISEIKIEEKKGFFVNYGIDLQLTFNPDFATQPAFNEYKELDSRALNTYIFGQNMPYFTELHQLNNDGNDYVGFMMRLGDSDFYLNWFRPIETDFLKFEGVFCKKVSFDDIFGYIDHTNGDVAPFPEEGMSCAAISGIKYFIFFSKSLTFSSLVEEVIYGTDFIFNVSYMGESYDIYKHLMLFRPSQWYE